MGIPGLEIPSGLQLPLFYFRPSKCFDDPNDYRDRQHD